MKNTDQLAAYHRMGRGAEILEGSATSYDRGLRYKDRALQIRRGYSCSTDGRLHVPEDDVGASILICTHTPPAPVSRAVQQSDPRAETLTDAREQRRVQRSDDARAVATLTVKSRKQALPGWDACTSLGSPDGRALRYVLEAEPE